MAKSVKRVVLAYSGGPRHLGHPSLADRDVPLRGRGLLRRPRAGRGADPDSREGPPHRRGGVHIADLREEFVTRLRLPDAARQRAVRGVISAGHVDRAAAHRQGAGRRGPAGRGGCGEPRRDRQGQRPGALRAHLRGARARSRSDRPVARVGPRFADGLDRVRAAPRHSRARDDGPAVLHRPQSLPHLVRGASSRTRGRSRRRRCTS